jgi:tetratricopeptide (TPR) repeat protein
MRYIFTLCMLLTLLAVEAQDYRKSIYQAYLHEEMPIWKELMTQMESELSRTSDPKLMYDLLEAEYGYTAWLISQKRKKEAGELIKSAEGHMARLSATGSEKARVSSIRGAFYGFKIMLDPKKAPSLGRSAMEASELAMELDPEEPQVWLEKANMEYYRPVIFGGSKRKAVPMYERAVELFEAAPERCRENWVYMNCLAGLGIAYENTRKNSEAGEVYRKILRLEPSFKWVKEELYPRFREKHPGK